MSTQSRNPIIAVYLISLMIGSAHATLIIKHCKQERDLTSKI